MPNQIRCCVLIFSVWFMVAGCSSTLPHTETGFLSDYDRLTPSTEFDNAMVYSAPDFNAETLASLTTVYIQPFEIWLAPAHLSVLGNDNVIGALAYFDAGLRAAVTPHYRLVDTPQPDSLIIRGAVTQVEVSQPEFSATDLIPFRVVMNAGNAAYLTATEQQDLITQIGLEIEFAIGEKNQVVFAMTSVKSMETTVSQGSQGTEDALQQVFAQWSNNFAKKLAEINR